MHIAKGISMKQMQFVEELSEILARKRLITSEEASSFNKLFRQKEDITFEDYLLEEDFVTKEDLLLSLAEYYSVPALDTVGEFFSHRLLRLFPKDVLLEHFMLPYRREGDVLTVVVASPDDPHLRELLGQYISHDISFMVGLAQDIRDTIQEFYDQPITFQPNEIDNQLMERSGQDVHPSDQLEVEDHPNEKIPLIFEETIDDYEK
jgi:hypothetical protein